MNILMIFTLYFTVLLEVHKLCDSASYTNLKAEIYIKNANISCCLQHLGPLMERSCSLRCTILDRQCNGFSVIDSMCKLCLVCGGSSNSVTFISGYAKYIFAGRYKNFTYHIFFFLFDLCRTYKSQDYTVKSWTYFHCGPLMAV